MTAAGLVGVPAWSPSARLPAEIVDPAGFAPRHSGDPVTPKSRTAGTVDVADLEFRVEENESGDERVTVDVESDLVPTEVRDDALNAVNKFLDQHEAADIEGDAGETIGQGWVDGERWEVTIYGDAVGEDEDTELESHA